MSPARRRGEDLAARAAVVAGRPPADEPAGPTRTPRTRPVRVTVELSPVEHRALASQAEIVELDGLVARVERDRELRRGVQSRFVDDALREVREALLPRRPDAELAVDEQVLDAAADFAL